MEMNNHVIYLQEWSLITEIGNGDPIRVYGRFFDHPNMADGSYGFPSSFVSFEPINKIGETISKRTYQLDNFVPNGNAKTEEIAIDWILKTIRNR